MHRTHRTTLLVPLVLLSVTLVRAQTPADPSGHWEGSVQIPGSELNFEIDLAKNGKGGLVGTFSSAPQHVKGLPFSKVEVQGRSVKFHARRDQSFSGVLSADGQSMLGDFSMAGYDLPFSLKRTGEARIEARPTSAPIGKELEGTWNGTLEANGMSMRFVLTMTNQQDGTATGNLVNVDEGGLEIPVAAISHQAEAVTFELAAVGGSYSGALTAGGTQLVGTYTQRGLAMPITFKLAKP